MNGIEGWPPADVAKAFVVRDNDWPDVEWPMNIMTSKYDNPPFSG